MSLHGRQASLVSGDVVSWGPWKHLFKNDSIVYRIGPRLAMGSSPFRRRSMRSIHLHTNVIRSSLKNADAPVQYWKTTIGLAYQPTARASSISQDDTEFASRPVVGFAYELSSFDDRDESPACGIGGAVVSCTKNSSAASVLEIVTSVDF